MKTRVVQDDSDEPSTQKHAVVRAPVRRSTNFAARMARWSANHRKKAIFGWLALAVVLFAVSFVSPMKSIVFETSGPGESGRADAILYNDFKQPAGEAVLIENPSLSADTPEFKAVVRSVITRLSTLDAVAKVESPYDADNSGQISDDKHSVLVPIEIRGPSDEAADKVDPIVDAVAGVQKANSVFYVGSFGESTGKEIKGAFYDDLKKAGLFSVPLTLLILVFAFGALVAAGIPLVLGLTAVLGTMGLVALFSQVLPMDDSVPAIILLIGLAVGVDYTMFYLKREREERAAGRSEEAALEAAAATNLTAVGEFDAAPDGCIALAAGGTVDASGAEFDPAFVSDCP